MRIAVALLAVLLCSAARAADDLADVRREVAARHDEAVKRLRDWIALPSIAAEGLNSAEGADYMARLARDDNDALKARIAVLEAKLGISASAPDNGTLKRDG